MRRRLPAVILAAALVASACTSSAPTATEPSTRIEIPSSEPTTATPSPTPTTPSPSPTPSEPLPPPEPAKWEPSGNEVLAGAKRVAAAIAHRLVNYDPEQPLADRVARITDDEAEREHLVETAAVLQHDGTWSRGSVVYPQLGGLRGDRTSVMVVVEQRFPRDADIQTAIRTLDVRLVRQDDGSWQFDQLASVGGQAPGPRKQKPAERALLANDRITLPDSARWDIEAGEISPVLIKLMSRMAERTSYDVVTLSSGHPFHVFATDRQSKHTKGQAVDLYLLEGDRIVDLREKGSTAHDLVRWLYNQPEVSEVGSPWALDGYGGRSFTDRVHQDHIHVGIVPRKPQPKPSETSTPSR